MKVLVSGANGLLGSYIVRELTRQGYKVRSLVRKGCNMSLLGAIESDIFEGSILNRSDIENAVSGCDYVIHSAAYTSPFSSSLSPFRGPNIKSTRYFIDVCKKEGIRRFIYVSTANCFGNGNKDNPGTEKNPFMPWLRKSGYAFSKYIAQRMVLDEVQKNQFQAIVVNPTFIIGAPDFRQSSGKIFSHVLNRKIIFYPPGGKNFVSAEAVAKGILQALENGRIGESYLLAGENMSYHDFFQVVSKTIGTRPIMIKLPHFLLSGLGLMGSLFEQLFKKEVQLTYTNAHMLCSENYYTSVKAVSEIGYKLVSVEQAIRNMLA